MRWSRVLKTLGSVLLGLILLGVALICWANKPRPEGRDDSEAADALARRFEKAIDLTAWRNTGAVKWTFGGRRHHLWDRSRGVAQITWGPKRALVYTGRAEGVAFDGDRRLEGEAAQSLIDDAHAAWINDAFWLNPLAKLRDDGVKLSVVDCDDETGLLVTYTQGGLTPGDAYLWLPGEDGLPRAWQMWVSNVPVGGLEVSWEGWKTLSTGARVSTRHVSAVLTLELSDVIGTATLTELLDGAPDPFVPLLEPAR